MCQCPVSVSAPFPLQVVLWDIAVHEPGLQGAVPVPHGGPGPAQGLPRAAAAAAAAAAAVPRVSAG